MTMAASVSEATRASAATRCWLCRQKSDEWKRATWLDAARRPGARNFNEDNATVPVALGMWDYSAVVAGCFAMGACRSVSLMRFDATGRVTNQALVNLPEGHLHRSQDASSRLLRTFIGIFAVHTFDPRQQHSVFISPASSLGAAFAGHRDLQRPTIFPQPSRL